MAVRERGCRWRQLLQWLILTSFLWSAASQTNSSAVSVKTVTELQDAVSQGATAIVLEISSLKLHGPLTGGSEGVPSAFPLISDSSFNISCQVPGRENALCDLVLDPSAELRFFTVGRGGILHASGLILRGGMASAGGAIFIGDGGQAFVSDSMLVTNNATGNEARGGAVMIEGGQGHFKGVRRGAQLPVQRLHLYIQPSHVWGRDSARQFCKW
uniref:Uncharacterized protein n=1 Tax=Tetraselmis sp. GSL018 TaxID=582737 RepID=A0A061QKU3_9CHLO